ncbi:MAG: hypothetical protein H7A35_14975 [Planctomycetales bacterium]|nr:hypothetical protein [bacterium]UNM08134.1 MAG: hypothetical protein H7A35_14975 [Planctomycetales bacterium]
MPLFNNSLAAAWLLFAGSSMLAIIHPNAAQANPDTFIIDDQVMEVEMYRDFPSIRGYHIPGSGLSFDAAINGPGTLIINGEPVEPVVSIVHHEGTASYTIDLPEQQVSLQVGFKLRGGSLHLKIGQLQERGEFRVHSLAFRDAPLLSCKSAADAQFAGANMYTKVEGTGDTYLALDGNEPVDDEQAGYMYAMLSKGDLCGSIWTNSVYDFPDGPTKRENGRIWKQTVADPEGKRTNIWSGDWLLRAEGTEELEPMAEARIVIAPDLNDDNVVDWQDGAIAYRSVMDIPLGAEQVKDQVVQRIVHNFGSQATNPFLKTLDETKRIYNATGGLGQHVLLKGYQNEGHDSAHPDYGGNYNERAGGLKDLKFLVEQGKLYNANFGVHINAQEAYPEAKSFTEDLTLEQKGWSWLDQAWVIDKRHDALSGNRLRRLEQLADELPGLQFIYLDVWYQDGWESRRVAREINRQGWALTTEFPNALEWDSTWCHWAVDLNYGGTDLKGLHSDIARFIHNHLRDNWVANHPLLGGTELMGYEGWQGRRDFNAMLETTFRANLPTKWLQHFEITNWGEDEIRFSGNVVAKLVDGRRVITQDGRVVLDGDSYLLPWPPENPEKYYLWSGSKAEHDWQSHPGLVIDGSFTAQIMDADKVFKRENLAAPADGTMFPHHTGKLAILAPGNNPFFAVQKFGTRSAFDDPGFNQGTTASLEIASDDPNVEVIRNEYGDFELHLPPGQQHILKTPLSVLSSGSYAISLAIEIRGAKPRLVEISVDGGTVPDGYPDHVWLDHSDAINYVAADSKHDRSMQRMQLIVDIDSRHRSPQLVLDIAAGNAEVFIDDLQCVPAVRPPLPDGAYFFEDFEHTVRGWYPFVRGDCGGASDMRTHLSQRHDPFTQRGWRDNMIDDVIDGDWSLKSHADRPGVLYRTIPQNLRFDPGYRYIVTLDYASSGDETHEIVISDSSGEEVVIPLKQALDPQPILFRFRAADDGSSWIGVRKPADDDSDLVIDKLKVVQEETPDGN